MLPSRLLTFANKEVEQDRAFTLKRLTFVVYAGESDQYARDVQYLFGE